MICSKCNPETSADKTALHISTYNDADVSISDVQPECITCASVVFVDHCLQLQDECHRRLSQTNLVAETIPTSH